MSCYLIKVENGHKVAHSITSEEEYKQLRGSNEQKANLRLARAGNDAAKRRLVQFNYSGHYPQGVVKGMKLPSGAFGFDMDEPEAFAKAAKLLLKEPDKYGLLMLERSARQGGHAVFEREKGKTVLENQVRIATMLKCEMDTSAHDINRVYFTTTSDDEDLLFLSPRLFKDEYDEAAVAAEGKVLEERERYGQEELPEGAHKANKHYEPWKEEFKKDSQGVFKGQEFKNSRISTSAASTSAASTSATSTTSSAQDNYLGIPYGEIIKKWWQMYNDGQEPMRSNRNTLTFELAVNLRHICGFDRNLLAQIIPCYDGFPEQEKMAPGVMASRTLPSERDRKMTILLTPFMSCSAKLPIYSLFAAAFFPQYAGLVMVLLYFTGIAVGVLAALLLKSTVFKGEAVPFVMELPNYRLPGLKNVAQLLWEKARDFLQKAFTVIFAATIVIWFLQNFDLQLRLTADPQASILARIAGDIAPLFGPLGFADWRISTALITGFMAKESVVSSLLILFGSEAALSAALIPVQAAPLLVFCLLYTPCIAAVASVKRELGNKWAVIMVVNQCAVAWLCALLVRLAAVVLF